MALALAAPTAPMSDAMTHDIRVEVMSRHVPEKSAANDGQWVFEYTARITNHAKQAMKLVSRHWFIADAFERVREIKGTGVVGQQPTLQPGEQFQYSSWCPLPTPTGRMHGTYLMTGEDSQVFVIEIAPFALRAKYRVQ